MVVTVDGPAGSGKSSASRLLAQELGFAFLDTGALYRAIALAARRDGMLEAGEAELAAWLKQVPLEAKSQGGRFVVFLDGQDVEPFIRNEAISQLASRLSALAPVREHLLGLQRAAGRAGDLVAEGRDMGTVVFPGAEAKFFLTAGESERAHRRWLELTQSGQQVDMADVLADLRLRDQRDSQRSLSPLRPAEDAVVLDTTPLSLSEVVAALAQKVRERRAGAPR
ncbi:MAG: (d)CMP kinase [Desulfarculaceae bacterium]|nr:(d)CMP kinase [Desulfarculaceae bacterium]MCF8046028.1 (d)CMP kinase [Desulfarculaceae bacterium]MCF8064175.1 (d)CMP kinase [Desulfarculaceae bacterium]MCF8098475.1 (d)CMP kinase [Desulfarculaceae bacterium]MCF8123048.1 (d)CMP kinase [Desulfarculaceae bacterium]